MLPGLDLSMVCDQVGAVVIDGLWLLLLFVNQSHFSGVQLAGKSFADRRISSGVVLTAPGRCGDDLTAENGAISIFRR